MLFFSFWLLKIEKWSSFVSEISLNRLDTLEAQVWFLADATANFWPSRLLPWFGSHNKPLSPINEKNKARKGPPFTKSHIISWLYLGVDRLKRVHVDGDNCCLCNMAGFKDISQATDDEIIYGNFNNKIFEVSPLTDRWLTKDNDQLRIFVYALNIRGSSLPPCSHSQLFTKTYWQRDWCRSVHQRSKRK